MAYDKEKVVKITFPLDKEYVTLLENDCKVNKRSKASQIAYIVEKYYKSKEVNNESRIGK